MSNIPEQLQSLYKELDRLKGSGEDVVADIRAEINNLELEYLNKEVFPKIAKSLGTKLAALRCEIDFSLQFDGTGKIDYSFCTSGSSIMMRNSVECAKGLVEKDNALDADSVISSPPSKVISSTAQPAITQTTNISSSCNPSTFSSKSQVPEKNKMWIEDNTARTFAVFGVPRDLFAEFRNKGGCYTGTSIGRTGWVFPLRLKDEISSLISDLETSVRPTKSKDIIPSQTSAVQFNPVTSHKEHKDVIELAPSKSIESNVSSTSNAEKALVYRVHIVPYSEKSIAVYGAPAKFTEEFKNRGGYFNTHLRGGIGWIFSKKREMEIRSLLLDNLVFIVDGEPTVEPVSKKTPSTEKKQSETVSVNNSVSEKPARKKYSTSSKPDAREFRGEFIKFLRDINKDQKSSYVEAFLELYIGALDSAALSNLMATVSTTTNIFDVRDYVYIPRLLKAVESGINKSRMQAHIMNALKYYHRFLFFKINGRDVEMLK